LSIFFAQGSLQSDGFKKALELLNLKPEECVAIGDQVFTDVIGANMMHIHSLYVEPINKKEFWYTAWKRPFEWIVLRCFFRGRNERKI
jgi:predicted HAD superfamily phosphohydrolase YqeG